ncbi:F0F1 ATP synthase subunit B [Ameyamaea chiangmaiensis]|uniref:ATP synthase subunit b n=1 Tax=Ameyamaea chiangmaiensis TaxID=442969 RepID=A0A850PJ54_9PROT|nr:F0F1 ATP synthase subunit B [Ameyamaea chiangmaiensis]MBS4075321.1 F0F1 ATP synthase subunit B [Ameyamaea chiangmaiensis]NVN41832.1 F0F1 ATP synthase subunit B [Ameyamaea chiangmaiensis]
MLQEPRFWSAVAFVLFFLLFGRKLWTPLAAALDGRAARIRADLDEAGRLRREAEQMLEDATREREQALLESQTLIEHSRVEAARIAEAARAEAEAIARRREEMARQRIAASERAAIRDVREAAVEIAVAAARDAVADTLTPDMRATLVDRALSDLPSALGRRAA